MKLANCWNHNNNRIADGFLVGDTLNTRLPPVGKWTLCFDLLHDVKTIK